MALLNTRSTLSPTFVFDPVRNNTSGGGGTGGNTNSSNIQTFSGDVSGIVNNESTNVELSLNKLHTSSSSTKTKITFNDKGLVTRGDYLLDEDIPDTIARKDFVIRMMNSMVDGNGNTRTFLFNQSSSIWNISHEMECSNFVCQVRDEKGIQVFPKKVTSLNENNVRIEYSSPIKGRVTFSFDRPQLVPDTNKRTFMFSNKKGDFLIKHDMLSENIICEVKNINDEKIFPNIKIVDENTLLLNFLVETSGKITVIFDRGVPVNIL